MYFEVYKDIKDEYRWRLKAVNHEVIARDEGYTSKQNRQYVADLLKSTTVTALVKEV